MIIGFFPFSTCFHCFHIFIHCSFAKISVNSGIADSIVYTIPLKLFYCRRILDRTIVCWLFYFSRVPSRWAMQWKQNQINEQTSNSKKTWQEHKRTLRFSGQRLVICNSFATSLLPFTNWSMAACKHILLLFAFWNQNCFC
jgi:hypothetical protein